MHDLSDNRFKRLDISDARERVGYAPQDGSTQELPQLKNLNLNDSVMSHNVDESWQNSGLRRELKQLEFTE